MRLWNEATISRFFQNEEESTRLLVLKTVYLIVGVLAGLKDLRVRELIQHSDSSKMLTQPAQAS